MCNVEGVSVSNYYDPIDLSGDHIDGRTNEQVTEVFVVSELSTMLEIPEIIFATFHNLEKFSVELNQLHRIDLANCGPRMRSVHINGNPITHLQNGAFRGCRTVETLQLMANNFQTIDENVFDDLPNLQEFEMCCSQLRELQENLFRAQTQLRTFTSIQNTFERLETIPSRIFETWLQVQSIDLRLTHFRVLQSGTFANHPNLESIVISHTGMESIEPGAFSNLPLLSLLDVSQNVLFVFDSAWFTTVLPSFNSFWTTGNGVFAFDRRIFDFISTIRFFNFGSQNCENSALFVIEDLEADVLSRMTVCFENFDQLE